ncbi:MAG: taurine transporter substrate binding subunit [Candidatus Bathyarchaeota archaeon BA2]|nr:MAG: taurine transporter substrate binding subunit [Candidatus Bathyarchaeota archaeon BA2]
MKRRLAAVIIAIVTIAAIATGVYYLLYLIPTGPPGLTKLRVGHLLADQLHQPGWVVAKEENYFADEGFEVVHSEYPYGSVEMEHFAAGEIDVAYVGAVPLLTARAAGVDVIAVASSNTEGSSIVVAGEIQNVADLAGKTIGSPGIGSIQDYMLDRVKAMYNITFNVHRAKVTLLIEKFSTHEIDGYIAWEPHATHAVVKGIRGAHTLLTSHEILEGHQCCVVAVRGDWVREAPYIVRRIIRWHMKAMRWVLEHPKEAEALIANYSKLPIELVERVYPIAKYPYPPLVHVNSCRIMLEGQIEAGKIKSEDVPDKEKFLSKAINNSFVESLNEELKPPTSLVSYCEIGGPALKWSASAFVETPKCPKIFERQGPKSTTHG